MNGGRVWTTRERVRKLSLVSELRRALGFAAFALLVASLVSCGLLVSFDAYDTETGGGAGGFTYAIGGSADGLGDAQVMLALNGGKPMSVPDGNFAFPERLAEGAHYAVVVVEVGPGHSCTIENGSGLVPAIDVTGIRVHCRLSSEDAELTDLRISAANLSPLFAPGTTLYTAGPLAVASFFPPPTMTTVTATAHEAHATITVEGVVTPSGQPSVPIALRAGDTIIHVVVTPEAGEPTKSYAVRVTGTRTTYVKASTSRADAIFGSAMALSGVTLAVGCPGEASRAGAVYVFARTGTTWSQQAYLTASNSRPGARFGDSVALEGDTLVVGSPQETSLATGVNGSQASGGASAIGATYVFTRTGSTWSQQAYVKASARQSIKPRFGVSVALSGETMAVGAEEEGPTGAEAGATYLFSRSAGTWSQQAIVRASNAADGAGFGGRVALSGDTLVVSAQNESSGDVANPSDMSALSAGAAYVFVRQGTAWSQQAYLKASNVRQQASFGSAVAVAGDTIAVGSYNESSDAKGINGDQTGTGSYGSGAVYVFTRSAAAWTQQAYVKASNSRGNLAVDGGAVPANHFGVSVALAGDALLVGADRESSAATGVDGDQANQTAPGAGAAYLFVRSPGASWSQVAYLKASNTRQNTAFGGAVALSADTLAVGSPMEESKATGIDDTIDANDVSASSAGAAYVYR